MSEDAKKGAPAQEETKAEAPTKRDAKAGDKIVKIDVPAGHKALKGGNCSVGGVSYTVDDNGFVIVPDEHAAILMRDHGFEAA